MSTKTFSLQEVSKHRTVESCWVVLHDKVFDVTQFMDEHPGGMEVLLENSGKFATENFEDIGHSDDARKLMKDYYIGDIIESDKQNYKLRSYEPWDIIKKDNDNSGTSIRLLLVPLIISILGFLLYRFLFSSAV